MHYLQSFLKVLIASNISTSRIMGILFSAGFRIYIKEFTGRQSGVSSTLLRAELKRRSAMCVTLFKIHTEILAELSAVGEVINVDPPSAKYELIRHQDGSIECQILSARAHHFILLNDYWADLPPYRNGPWMSEEEAFDAKKKLEVKKLRFRYALQLELSLDLVIKGINPPDWYHRDVKNTRSFIQKYKLPV